MSIVNTDAYSGQVFIEQNVQMESWTLAVCPDPSDPILQQSATDSNRQNEPTAGLTATE